MCINCVPVRTTPEQYRQAFQKMIREYGMTIQEMNKQYPNWKEYARFIDSNGRPMSNKHILEIIDANLPSVP